MPTVCLFVCLFVCLYVCLFVCKKASSSQVTQDFVLQRLGLGATQEGFRVARDLVTSDSEPLATQLTRQIWSMVWARQLYTGNLFDCISRRSGSGLQPIGVEKRSRLGYPTQRC